MHAIKSAKQLSEATANEKIDESRKFVKQKEVHKGQFYTGEVNSQGKPDG